MLCYCARLTLQSCISIRLIVTVLFAVSQEHAAFGCSSQSDHAGWGCSALCARHRSWRQDSSRTDWSMFVPYLRRIPDFVAVKVYAWQSGVWHRLVLVTWSLRSSFTLTRKVDQLTIAMRLSPEACSSSTLLQLKMGELISPHRSLTLKGFMTSMMPWHTWVLCHNWQLTGSPFYPVHSCRPSELSAEIRAPIPIMKDTLYGEGAQHMLRHHSKSRHACRPFALLFAYHACFGHFDQQPMQWRLFITHCSFHAMLLQEQWAIICSRCECIPRFPVSNSSSCWL